LAQINEVVASSGDDPALDAPWDRSGFLEIAVGSDA
jgi:hypothetical protein